MSDNKMQKQTFYEHIVHGHVPMNVNLLHAHEQLNGNLNAKIAVVITRGLGTMTCAYVFALLALLGFPGLHATVNGYIQWLSQTFIQLTALSVLAVGQSVLGRKQELQSNEVFDTTQHMFHDLQQMIIHLDKQDEELLKQTQILLAISQRILENKDAG